LHLATGEAFDQLAEEITPETNTIHDLGHTLASRSRDSKNNRPTLQSRR
jgi:hypothetical protein